MISQILDFLLELAVNQRFVDDQSLDLNAQTSYNFGIFLCDGRVDQIVYLPCKVIKPLISTRLFILTWLSFLLPIPIVFIVKSQVTMWPSIHFRLVIVLIILINVLLKYIYQPLPCFNMLNILFNVCYKLVQLHQYYPLCTIQVVLSYGYASVATWVIPRCCQILLLWIKCCYFFISHILPTYNAWFVGFQSQVENLFLEINSGWYLLKPIFKCVIWYKLVYTFVLS